MKDGGAIMTMSYEGANRVAPHYGIMGLAKASLEAATRALAAELGPQKIAVNAISPVRSPHAQPRGFRISIS